MDLNGCPPPDLDARKLPHAGEVLPLTAETLTVVIGTYGEGMWQMLAESRAMPSARALGVQVVHVHADSLQEARNRGLAEVETDWVTFLDADDELESGYLDAMRVGTADVRAPAVRYVRGSHWQQPYVPQVAGHSHACVADCLMDGNWLVIGSAVLSELVRGVGGFRDFAWSEDWDVWLRCHLAGATFEAIPAAVYRAYVRTHSRNRAPHHTEKWAAHKAIADANGIPMPR